MTAGDGGSRSGRALLAHLLEGRRRLVVGLAGLSVGAGLLEAGFLVLVTRAAFALAQGDTSVTGTVGPLTLTVRLPVLLAVAAALVAVRLALALVGSRLSATLVTEPLAATRLEMAEAFLRAPWSVQATERGGRLQELLTTFTERVGLVLGSFTQVIASSFSLGALLVAAVVVDVKASVAVVVATVVLAFVLRPLRLAARRQAAVTAATNAEFASGISELSQLGQEVHVFQVRGAVLDRIGRLVQHNQVARRRLAFLSGLVQPLYTGMAFLSIVVALGVVYAIGLGSLASFGAVMLVMLRSLTYGQAIQTSYTTLQSSLPYLEQLDGQLAALRSAEEHQGGEPIRAIGTIRFRDVSFAYVPGRPVLRNLDFVVPPREVVGIVGPSGSGKSTLVQLLLRLRQPTEGLIEVDDRDVRRLDRDEWARRVTFVAQDARLLSASVADNIRFFRTEVDDADVERAAALAGLHDDIVSWPEGYLTPVGERGGQLSGGQRQRLCIARALVEHPDVLILDEPTSVLDVRSESLIRESLASLRDRMTVVVIAHRLSTLDICDRIMVIQDGQLRAFGTPAALAESSPFFQEALVLSGLR